MQFRDRSFRLTNMDLQSQTGEGILKINELQLEGKKRMAADALLRGFTITPGEILGHQE